MQWNASALHYYPSSAATHIPILQSCLMFKADCNLEESGGNLISVMHRSYDWLTILLILVNSRHRRNQKNAIVHATDSKRLYTLSHAFQGESAPLIAG